MKILPVVFLLVSTVKAFSATRLAPKSNTAQYAMFPDSFTVDETVQTNTTVLVERAKHVLSPHVGLGTKDGGDCLAHDFEFCAAVVGPIGKQEYLQALSSFDLEQAFDIEPKFYGFFVDPMQPNRVWFFNRLNGTHTGTFMGTLATGKQIEYPPQVHHLDFDNELKIREYGFYTADRRQGNTGGLGGAFGFMYGIGKPLPIRECHPYKPSFRFRWLNRVGRLAQRFSTKKKE